MIRSCLCYIACKNEYLMLYRNKKEADPNEGKWLGVGGKLEENESPMEAVVREIREETGIVVLNEQIDPAGIIMFFSDKYETEEMNLFHATLTEKPKLINCSEGTLAWIKKEDLNSLPMWEGDKIFLDRLLNNDRNIHISLKYEGDNLVEAIDTDSNNQL